MPIAKSVRAIIILAMIVAAAAIVAVRVAPAGNTSSPALAVGSPPAPALTQTYRNADWGFSIKMPADFSAYPPDGKAGRDANGHPYNESIFLQNQKGSFVQIAVTQDENASRDNTFTATDLAREAPSVDPSTAQPVRLSHGVTGMTFTEGPYPPSTSSTDVLIFTYRGNLYELSADTKDRALFEAMMDTWTFQ